jgi:hypothetical protein
MPKEKEAIVYLNKVVNSAEYGSQAYYLDLWYMKAMITKATKYFDEVSGEEKYKEKLSHIKPI